MNGYVFIETTIVVCMHVVGLAMMLALWRLLRGGEVNLTGDEAADAMKLQAQENAESPLGTAVGAAASEAEEVAAPLGPQVRPRPSDDPSRTTGGPR